MKQIGFNSSNFLKITLGERDQNLENKSSNQKTWKASVSKSVFELKNVNF